MVARCNRTQAIFAKRSQFSPETAEFAPLLTRRRSAFLQRPALTLRLGWRIAKRNQASDASQANELVLVRWPESANPSRSPKISGFDVPE